MNIQTFSQKTAPRVDNKRNVGLDLLRCLLMYAIVVHHCCLQKETGELFQIQTLFLFTLPAVDCFVGITGWFGIRFSFRKLFSLLFQIGCCSGLLSLVSFLCAKFNLIDAPLISPGAGWFSVCYIAFYCTIPFVGWVVHSSDIVRRWLLIFEPLLVLLALCLWWRAPVWFISFVPIGGSHSVGTMILVYLCTRLLCRYKSHVIGHKKGLLVGTGFLLSLMVCYGVLRLKQGVPVLMTIPNLYASPLIVVLAVTIVALFSSMTALPHGLTRVVAFLKPSVFSVYLLHDAHLFGHEMLVSRPLHLIFKEVMPSGLTAVFVVLTWAFLVYCVTILVDWVFRRIFIARTFRKMSVLWQERFFGTRRKIMV